MTAVTTCWFCALTGDKSPLAARSGHLPDTPGDWPPAPGAAGAPREQYAKLWQPGGKTARPQPGSKQRATCPGPRAEAHGSDGDRGAAQTISRLSRRRSRSDSPPQIPNRSSCSSAYSRHSARTSQPRHTFLASLVEPPFSGKNASGSVCAHNARSCQSWPPASSSPIPNIPSGTTSATAHLLPCNPVGYAPYPPASAQTTQVKLHARVLRPVKRDT